MLKRHPRLGSDGSACLSRSEPSDDSATSAHEGQGEAVIACGSFRQGASLCAADGEGRKDRNRTRIRKGIERLSRWVRTNRLGTPKRMRRAILIEIIEDLPIIRKEAGSRKSPMPVQVPRCPGPKEPRGP